MHPFCPADTPRLLFGGTHRSHRRSRRSRGRHLRDHRGRARTNCRARKLPTRRAVTSGPLAMMWSMYSLAHSYASQRATSFYLQSMSAVCDRLNVTLGRGVLSKVREVTALEHNTNHIGGPGKPTVVEPFLEQTAALSHG